MSNSTLSSHSSTISLNYLSQYDLQLAHIEFDHRMADILNSTILHFWSSSTTCDLLFLVSHRRYYAHSFILFTICRSLRNHLIDYKSSTIKYTCQLKLTTSVGLELLLIYIYTSRVILNVETISDLFLAAHELDVEHILQRCIQFLNDSIDKMYEKPKRLSLLWSFITSCLSISDINQSLCERIIAAIKYFYPKIISSKRFLDLRPNILIQIFELIFPNDIPLAILIGSLHRWAKFTDQSNRQMTIDYLVSKYINSSKSISNHFSNMENKLHELMNYQNQILHRLDEADESSSLISSKEETLWITESEATINSNENNQYLWHEQITTIAVCCTSITDRKKIHKDFQVALRVFNQLDSSKPKYALIHTGKYIYAIGDYKTRMYKFHSTSHQVQYMDGPYPGRSQFGLAADLHHLVLIGGMITEEKSLASSLLFNYQQEQWYSLPDIPLRNQQGVFSSGVCFIDHETLIIVGGLITTSEGAIAMRKCFRLDLNQRKWFIIASCKEARGQSIVSYYSDRVYAIGGLQYIYDKIKRRTSINVMSIEEYNIHTDQWTILTTINQLRYQKSLYCTNTGLLLGTDEKNHSWSYDLIKRHLTCNFGLSA